jgi:hypothetical protein
LSFFTAPAASSFAVHDPTVLDLRDDAWVPLVRDASAGGIIVATRQLGLGRVYVATTDALFSNAHLADADNAALVLNVLARLPPRADVVFDEYHHGEASAPDLARVALASPWGWAILYAALASFVFVLWAGRRFGPALVTPRAPGRSAADYVTAFAGLLQRQAAAGSDARGWAQHRYARHVRQRLARAHGLRADLPPTDLARLLAERRPIDAGALARSLAALDGSNLTERALLARIRELEPILAMALDKNASHPVR